MPHTNSKKKETLATPLKYTFGAIRSPPDDRDYLLETILANQRSRAVIPSKVDMRPNLQPVMDQGLQGSCSACAASACKEWQEYKDVNLHSKFSAQYIYNNRIGYPAEGMYGRNTMDILLKKGCCRESYYRYGLHFESGDKIGAKANDNAARYKIKSYARVDTLDGLKQALFNFGPCWIAFPAYNYGMEFWKQNNGEKIIGGHAVSVVGYDDKKAHFIIRNSWGLLWGDFGYTYLPYSDFGKQWEIWSMVDDKSPPPLPDPNCQCVLL